MCVMREKERGGSGGLFARSPCRELTPEKHTHNTRTTRVRPGAKGGRDLSLVECGRPFYLEVQALDPFSNK